MTRKYGSVVLFFVAYFLLIASATSPLHAETISFAVLDYCPYMCDPQKENGKIGFVMEIQKTIFERAGYEVQTTFLPWRRLIVGVEKGEYDATPLNNSRHSDVIIRSKETSSVLRQIFYVRKGDTWRYNGIPSLANITIGNVIGYNYSPFSSEFEEYCQQHKDTNKVQYIGGEGAAQRNLQKIVAGRITTFNEDAGLTHYITTKIGIRDQLEEAGTLGNNIQYVGFSPKNPKSKKYAEIYDKGIREMRASGELERILRQYSMEDWEKYLK